MTKSLYGDRDTVGTIAVDAMLHGEKGVCAGDMGHEMMKSLVDDLNTTIASNPFEGKEFYITVHEKKDALLTNTVLRRMCVSEFRPFPEPCTTVFRTNPKTSETWFCWALPHWSHYPQIMANPDYYHPDTITDVKAYMSEDNEHFGFNGKGKEVEPIPNFKDREMNAQKKGNIGYKPKIIY